MPLIETLPPIRNMSPIPQADMGQLSLLAVLLFSNKYSGPSISLGSAPVDTEGRLYCAIFYKGPEHPPMLIDLCVMLEGAFKSVLRSPWLLPFTGLSCHPVLLALLLPLHVVFS